MHKNIEQTRPTYIFNEKYHKPNEQTLSFQIGTTSFHGAKKYLQQHMQIIPSI